ncbi:MAG: hypothetical protein HC932_03085 [Thermales bacterium]|nr:hypothetical protein [Thermales bacterium]
MTQIETTKNFVPPWYLVSVVVPAITTLMSVISSLWVGKLLGVFSNQLTIETNKEIKEEQRIEELAEMVTLQQIKDVVEGSESRILTLIKNQGDGLGQRIDSVKTELKGDIKSLDEKINSIDKDLNKNQL